MSWIKVGDKIWDLLCKRAGRVKDVLLIGKKESGRILVGYTGFEEPFPLSKTYEQYCCPLGCMIVMDEEKIYG